MKKVLFLIRDLGHGGAEKVLVNLVNHMDRDKFDITVMTLFDEGINKQFLAPHIKYKTCFKKSFPGNSHFLKLFSPAFLHKHFIKESYDIEIAYLEGPSARVISGCQNKNTKLISWIHIEFESAKAASTSFRSKKEAEICYNKFNKIIGVSKKVLSDFTNNLNITTSSQVLYNTNNTADIITKSLEETDLINSGADCFKWCGIGRLIPHKKFDRLLRIQKKILQYYPKTKLYILGTGSQESELKQWCLDNGIEDNVIFLGYQENPYKFVSKCDLFACASLKEGFSTAATEALIVGTPVCTVEVAGMKEMLGENNEFGIVTENNEEALYEAIKSLVDNPELLKHYKEKAIERGKFFCTEKTVKAVETMLSELLENNNE